MVIKNLKLALRNLINQSLSTIINVLGLIAGLSAAMFVLLFILNEVSYDKHHKNINRIYRINELNKAHQWMMATTPYPLAEIIKEESPVVETAVRIERLSPVSIRKDEEWINEDHIHSCGPELFDMFSFPILHGSPIDLNNPNTAIFSKESTSRYFGSENPIGKTFEMRLKDTILLMEVVGIMKDPPKNITFRPEIIVSPELGLLSMSKSLITTGGPPPTPEDIAMDWEFNFFTSYLLLKEDADTSQVYTTFRSLEKQYYGDEALYKFHLQPLSDIYLGSGHLINVSTPQGDRQVLFIFTGIGILIIFISLLNYILLYSGQTMARIKEYGLRRIAGANRRNLITQILTETIVVVLIVVPICLALVESLRPFLSQFLDKQMVIESRIYWQYSIGVVIISLLVGIIPGLSMITFITRLRPILIMESIRVPRKGQSRLRTALIFCQFIVFNILIISSLGVYKQVQYPMKKDLGYLWQDLEILQFQQGGTLSDRFDEIKNELTSMNGITGVSGGMFLPPTNSVMSINMKKLDGSDESVNLEALFVDKDFIETMGINLLEGRSISEFSDYGERKILLNRKAIDQLGTENPIGEKLFGGDVVGIVDDFNTHSLHREIPPTMIISGNDKNRQMVIRVENNRGTELRNQILSIASKYFPDGDLEVYPMEDELKNLYKKERITAATVGVFTVIAIIIGAMGLFGVSMHMLSRRRKEFAIRKVSGARSRHIVRLLARNYLVLILSTLAIASPLAIMLLNRWLQNFVYRTPVSWLIFVLAGILAIVIVSLTTGFHLIRAARINPTENLRYE